MTEKDDWMRNHVKKHRMKFLDSLRSSAELFIEGFPGLQDYQRDKINNLLRYSNYLTANGVLIDFIVRIDGFPKKFLKFCKTHSCNPELVQIIEQGLHEYQQYLQKTGRRQQAFYNTSQTRGIRNLSASPATRSFQLDTDYSSSQNDCCQNINSQMSDENNLFPDQTESSSLELVDKSRFLLLQIEEINFPANPSQVDSILQSVATLGSCNNTTTNYLSFTGETTSASQNSELLRCPCPYHEQEQNALTSTDNEACCSRNTSGSSPTIIELATQQARQSSIAKKQSDKQQGKKKSMANKQSLTQHARKCNKADKQSAIQQAKERNIHNIQPEAQQVTQNMSVAKSNSAVAQNWVQRDIEINNMNQNIPAQKRSCGNKIMFVNETGGQEEVKKCSFNSVTCQISQTITGLRLTNTGERENNTHLGIITSVQQEGASIQNQAGQPKYYKCCTVNDYMEEEPGKSESSYYLSSGEYLNFDEDAENSCLIEKLKHHSIWSNNCAEKGEDVQANYQQKSNFSPGIVCIKNVKCSHLSAAPPFALKRSQTSTYVQDRTQTSTPLQDKSQTSTTVQDIEDLKLEVSTSPEIEDLKLQIASLQEQDDLQFENTVPKVISFENLQSTNLNKMKPCMHVVDTFQELESMMIQSTASKEKKSLQNEETSPKSVDSKMHLKITSLENYNTKLEPCDKKDMGSAGFEITFKESEVCDLQFNMAVSRDMNNEPKSEKCVKAAPAIFVLVNADCSGTQCQEDRDRLQMANKLGESGND